MATIIRNLPFSATRTSVEVGGRSVSVATFQPVVWVSIAFKGTAAFDQRVPIIPAVVDLGFNGTFAIREEQLHEWAGFDPRSFPRLCQAFLRGVPTDQRLANLWLHPNAPNRRDPSGGSPFHLELFKGIFVLQRPQRAGQDDHRPRLPLLGVYALHRANLRLIVDCGRCRLTVRTASRFRLFG